MMKKIIGYLVLFLIFFIIPSLIIYFTCGYNIKWVIFYNSGCVILSYLLSLVLTWAFEV